MNASVDALLAASAWSDSVAKRVAAELPEEVVEGPARTRVLAAVQSLVADGVTVDPTTLLARLSDSHDPGWDDAVRWLPELVTAPSCAGTVGWHLERLHDTAARIRLRLWSARMQQAADQPDLHGSVETVREGLERLFTGTTTAPPTVADMLNDYLGVLETSDDTPALATGLVDLDAVLGGGLRPGQLCIVGARPGVGKSVLLSDIARHAALRQDARVLFRSLEMSRDEILARFVAAETHVDLGHLIGRQVTDDDWSKITRRLGPLSVGNLHVDDRASLTVPDLHAQARGLRPSLLVVDYLQLVKAVKPSGSRQEDVAAISRGLKLLARDLNCPVLVAAQLNRALTSRSDTRPRLSDLRESGAIEADADVVILLDRDPDDDTQGTTARALVEKNRSGPTGAVDLAFFGYHASFTNLNRHGGAS